MKFHMAIEKCLKLKLRIDKNFVCRLEGQEKLTKLRHPWISKPTTERKHFKKKVNKIFHPPENNCDQIQKNL